MSALAKYDAACRALSEAKTVDEVREISNQAEALRAYARQAKNRQLEVDAAEIRIRAERRMGEMLCSAKRDGGFKNGRPPNGVSRAKLREAGIDNKLSARSQKLASIPAEKFEQQVSDWRGRASASKSRVTADINLRSPSQSSARIAAGEPFKLPGRDIRNMRVGELIRFAAFVRAVADFCGAGDHSARVGECVADSRIREAARS